MEGVYLLAFPAAREELQQARGPHRHEACPRGALPAPYHRAQGDSGEASASTILRTPSGVARPPRLIPPLPYSLRLLLALLLLAACTARPAAPARVPATVPPGGATANALGSTSVLPPPLLPSGAQAFAHVETLAGVIGPRLVGTAGHDAAANYLTAQWEKLGYRVQRQPFVARFQEDRSTLTVTNPPGDARVLALNRSATGRGEAPGFDAGGAA